MGKTALATNIAYREAQVFCGRKIVCTFSLEMSSEQLSTRILSEQAKLSLLEEGRLQKKR